MTIKKAMENAILAIEALDTTEVLISQSKALNEAKNDLIRGMLQLEQVFKTLRVIEENAVFGAEKIKEDGVLTTGGN